MMLMRRTRSQPLVRPWALASPILILLVALPLLRPLRHPDANEVSDDEAARLATIAAVVDHHSLSLEGLDLGPGVPLPDTGLIRSRGHIFSRQPPMMAVLLAGPYWLMSRAHLTLRAAPTLAPFLLTLFGVTIPVALAAGLLYKMARVFELRRPIRCLLAAAVVFGSGMFSYAVVLNPHAPAAALVLGAVGALIYVANSRKPRRNIWWLIASGACAGLALTLDPPAAVFPIPLILTIFVMRWPIVRRTAGAALFLLGLVPPVYFNLALNFPVTGDWKPALMHRELEVSRTGDTARLATWSSVSDALAPAGRPDLDPDDNLPLLSGWRAWLRPVSRLIGCLFGQHGLLTHFPILIIAALGLFGVLRGNWPGPTKAVALTTAVGAVLIVLAYSLTWADVRGAMFANRWFIAFLPLAVFWSGAWLRHEHYLLGWSAACLLLIFSVCVSILGATDPLPRNGYDHYTAAAAAQHLFGPSANADSDRVAMAGQN
jgi:hypothetical protein